jgi:hypothetical protein
MAVIVRERVTLGGSEVELPTYLPSGRLSKEDRLRAEHLDEVLTQRIPAIARELQQGAPQSLVRRWYELGRRLRTLVDDPELVSRADVHSGHIWLAIWHYLPDSIKPAGLATTSEYQERQHKRKDHLSLCYEISKFDWPDVGWIRRWDDWHQIAFRPGILRDKRVLSVLGRTISQLSRYPSREQFREIVKILGETFPTRSLRDSSVLSKDLVESAVIEAVAQATQARAPS